MKHGGRRFLCLLMVLCMMPGCASPADKGTDDTGNMVTATITPTNKPVEEATPTVTPTVPPVEDKPENPESAVFMPEDGDLVTLANQTGAAPIYIDANGPAFAGLRLIADAVAGDVEAVTGSRPLVLHTEPERGVMIIAGLVNEEIITKEGLTWEIGASDDSFKSADFERYQIQVKEDGEKTKIIVAGADKRGTIYGLFHITQDLCGVSPWIWWADAKPAHQDSLSFAVSELEVTSKRPSVNYRGFFLNDENPSLSGFADSHFGGLNYMFYSHVCELMLRLKGNYLWPAMWSNGFNLDGMEGVVGKYAELEKEYHHMLNGVMYIDSNESDINEYGTVNINRLYGEKISVADGGTEYGTIAEGYYPMSLANAVIADHYGVMVGASHHEPMARAGVEWGKFKGTYYSAGTEAGAKSGAWNYYQNVENISNFWSDSIARNGNFSTNLYTVGMRGENDSPLTDITGKKLTTAENAQLLKDILNKQDEILESFGQGDTPRLFCLYKEVETCWYGGNRDNPAAADDSYALRKDATVQKMLGADTNNIVMFCEDNNGYLRTLAEYGAKDDYNYGLYYHFDYVGGPRTSMWINTMPLQRTWDNMTTAYEYGADDAWIVNVGDLKPMELPLSYFLDLAYDFESYGSNNPNSVEEYTQNWVRQQFAAGNLDETEVQELAEILTEYTDMNGASKPETLNADTYSVINYNEAQKHLAAAIRLEELANKYLEKFENTELYDAYYELVYYPAAATANANKLWVYMALNQQYAQRGSMLANVYGELVEEALETDRTLTATYNTLGGEFNGKAKWYRMMVTAPGNGELVCGVKGHAHLNYSGWNHESSAAIVPTYVQGAVGSQLIVDVEGDAKGYSNGTVEMPAFHNLNKEAYAVTLSNGGGEYLSYEITNVPDWVKLDGPMTGGFYVSQVVGVSVDWQKVKKDTAGSFEITSGGQKVTVTVTARVTEVPEDIDDKAAFVLDGEASIVADNYADKGASANGTRWEVLENYGKTGATVKMFPVYTDDFASGEGPWVEYKVYVPAGEPTGEYRITGYFGQSNNISFDEGNHLNVGVQVNGGTITTVNTLENGYIAGDSSSWSYNIMYAGHTMSLGTTTLQEGVNTIRIYGMDQNLMLQKLVLVSGNNAPKASFAGPVQSYYAGLGEVAQQTLVCNQAEEAMFLPGSVLAKDCSNEEAVVTDGALAAVKSITYTYDVTVTTEAKYLFSVTGTSASGATVTVQVDESEALSFALESTEQMADTPQPVLLSAGKHVIKLTVSDNATIRSVMAEVYDDTQGRLLKVESTGGDAEYAYRAVDRKASSAWQPTESNPTLTLDLGEIAYADYFTLSGDLTGVTGYKLEVSEDGSKWTTVYTSDSAPVNGNKVYFQGTQAYRGSKWRFSFTGTVKELNEVELHTYMNWTLEVPKTYTTGGNNPDRPSSDPTKTADGNRIGHPKNKNGFIADVGTNMTVTFDNGAYPMTGVILSGMQLEVDENMDGVIPTDILTSDRAPASYEISYRKEDGTWVTLDKTDSAKKVLTYVEFDNGNEVMVTAIKIHISGWARVMEVEAVQMIDYTLNGEVYTNPYPIGNPSASMPTVTPEPTATPAPAPGTENKQTIPLDLSSANIVYTKGEKPVNNADGSVTFSKKATEKVSFAFPETVSAGEEVKVTVRLRFDSAEDTKVRFYMISNGNDVNTAGDPVSIANEATGTEIVKTVTLKAVSDSTELLFASSGYGTNIENVTIYEIKVEAAWEADDKSGLVADSREDLSNWVTTWGTAEEKCKIGDNDSAMPKMELEGTTIRQIIRVTSDGSQICFRLSNQYGESDVEIQSMHVAKQSKAALADGTGFGTADVDMSTILTSTDTVVTVGGNASFVIPKGEVIITDPVEFSVEALDNLAVSMYFGKTPTQNITGHRGARATTYQVKGNQVSQEVLSDYQTTTSWFFLADASVYLPGGKAVVCFGDSITDGYGTDVSYLGKRPDSYIRWVDYLAKRLQENEGTQKITLINEGIGANSILGSYPTDSGKKRFSRDLLEHDNVAYCIILFGTNDIGNQTDTSKFDKLIAEYQKMIELCHENGIKVYGAPILPFGSSSNYTEASEKLRTMINDWMRSEESQFDGIIDFESALADPDNPICILHEYTYSDGLHPYEGYDVMAEAVDLSMFME